MDKGDFQCSNQIQFATDPDLAGICVLFEDDVLLDLEVLGAMAGTWSPSTMMNGIVSARVGGSEKPANTTNELLNF